MTGVQTCALPISVGINDFYRADQGWIPFIEITAQTNARLYADVNAGGYRYVNPERPNELFFWSNIQNTDRWSSLRGKGLVVLTACSHAGVVNVLAHARDCFPGVKLHAVLGGLHLSGTNERIIPQTVSALGDFGLDVIAAGHCTGWRAMTALANAFGDGKLVPLAVGKRMRF